MTGTTFLLNCALMLLATPLVDGAHLRRNSLGRADQLSPVKESTPPPSPGPISSGRRLRNGVGCVRGQFHISIAADEPSNSCSNSDVYPREWDHPNVAPFIFYDTAAACCERVIRKTGKCHVINACNGDGYDEMETLVGKADEEAATPGFEIYSEPSCGKTVWRPSTTALHVCTNSDEGYPNNFPYLYFSAEQCCTKSPWADESTPCRVVDVCDLRPTTQPSTGSPSSSSALQSWYVHPPTNKCVQDCAKERGTYCGGEIPSWSTPFESADLCCNSISWKPRDECVVEVEALDPTSGAAVKSWYVNPSTNECVQDCAKERGTYCGGEIPSWSTPFQSADLCCDSLSWKPRGECVVEIETLAPTSQPIEGMSAIPSTSPTDESKYNWYVRDTDQVCVQNCETDQGIFCGGIVNQYKETYRSVSECCAWVAWKPFEECRATARPTRTPTSRPSESIASPSPQKLHEPTAILDPTDSRPEISCPSQRWYLYRVGRQSLCVKDVNYDDGTYDSSNRDSRNFSSSEICCDRRIAGKKCNVIDVCDHVESIALSSPQKMHEPAAIQNPTDSRPVISCQSQRWYLYRVGRQSLCVNDANYDDGTYDSSNRDSRYFSSSKICCDRRIAGKKCNVIDVCNDA